MRNLSTLFWGGKELNWKQSEEEEEKLISTIYNNISTIVQEPLLLERLQHATYGLQGF